MIERWIKCDPVLAEWLTEMLEDCLAVSWLPKGHRVRLCTTSNPEKLHQEVKCRTRVVRILPNRRSCLRLISALAMGQSEERLTDPRYLTMAQTEAVAQPEKEDVLQPVA